MKTKEQKQKIIDYILEHRKEYKTDIACVTVAHDMAGDAGTKVTSSVANYWMKKARKSKPKAPKKKVQELTVTIEPINFCPRCGLHLKAISVAMGL